MSYYFPPHSQLSFLEPLIVNDLQKQGWIWVLHKVPKRRMDFGKILITNTL